NFFNPLVLQYPLELLLHHLHHQPPPLLNLTSYGFSYFLRFLIFSIPYFVRSKNRVLYYS
ncbi:MAG: hypothetical protein AAB309_00025, partial [Deltaproteobacteria bacterium]